MEEMEPIRLTSYYVNADGSRLMASRVTDQRRRFETAAEVQAAIDGGEFRAKFSWEEGSGPEFVDYPLLEVYPLPPSLPSFIRNGARWEIRFTLYHPKSLKLNLAQPLTGKERDQYFAQIKALLAQLNQTTGLAINAD